MCGVLKYASAQSLAFLDLAKKSSFWAQKRSHFWQVFSAMSGVLRGVCACDVQQYVSAKRLACPAIVPFNLSSFSRLLIKSIIPDILTISMLDDGGCGLAYHAKYQPEMALDHLGPIRPCEKIFILGSKKYSFLAGLYYDEWRSPLPVSSFAGVRQG